MPIYHKAPPSIAGSHTTADIDYHTSEAAKVKRTREQAYFNSYDFDAIEVLPYDDEDEEEKGGKSKTKTTTKSKSKLYSQQQPSRQHLSQQSVKYQHKQHQQHQSHAQNQPQHYQQQAHPLSSVVTHKTSLSNPLSFATARAMHNSPSNDDGNSSSNNNNTTFTIDNPDDSHIIGNSNRKYHSYLQRFGVAIFGGNSNNNNNNNNNNSNKKTSQPQPQLPSSSSSSSSSSTLTATLSANSTISSLPNHDAHKHLKVLPTTPSRPAALSLSCSSSNSDSSASISSSVVVNADSLRHSSDDNTHVHDVGAIAVAATVAGTGVGAAAATTAAVDGNFLLPRVMLKYQRYGIFLIFLPI